MSMIEPVGQDVSGGFARRLGGALLDAPEDAERGRAARRAVSKEELRPVHNKAMRAARAAEGDELVLLDRYEEVCAALLLGEAEEADVEEVERELSAVRRDRARYEAADRALSRRRGVIRDSTGARVDR